MYLLINLFDHIMSHKLSYFIKTCFTFSTPSYHTAADKLFRALFSWLKLFFLLSVEMTANLNDFIVLYTSVVLIIRQNKNIYITKLGDQKVMPKNNNELLVWLGWLLGQLNRCSWRPHTYVRDHRLGGCAKIYSEQRTNFFWS